MEWKKRIDRLEAERTLSPAALGALLESRNEESAEYLFAKARAAARKSYGRDIYMRGLIECTNHCKNDCYYCGIRAGNREAKRYRLTPAQILDCCRAGYDLGFRTFVLQGGEDPHFTDERMVGIVRSIKQEYPDCALTLSMGERNRESYQALFDAGADRYLLRHETADPDHYAQLHPQPLTLSNRKRCLLDLKEIGFQAGCGFMVGSPYQTPTHLIEDLLFIKELRPQMVGIGPFIPHAKTPFAGHPAGTLELTLFLLAMVRLLLPDVLLPATTALGTIHPKGRELGILAGANVVMPNLTPARVREQYLLYDNKLCTGDEAAEHCASLTKRIERIGYSLVTARGDYKPL